MKPILFNTDMVQAILEGRKSVTRRIVKPQPKSHIAYACMGSRCGKWGYPGKDAWKYWDDDSFRIPDDISQDELKVKWTPPCHTDDILYVRETWAVNNITPHDPEWLYKADYDYTIKPYKNWRWRPSIHMPKEAARLFLRVIDVRVERLREITCEQAYKEGCTNPIRFDELWDSTIKPADLPLYGWEADPLVWVIEFERISKEVALEGGDEG